jgi:DhnA family fructose-bisphosphate aldolase class Ia
MSELSGRRYHRLFGSDGRSVVAAMDHGSTWGALPGFEDPQKVVEEVIAGGADVVLTTVGIARKYSKQLSHVGLMLRCDGATSPLMERPRELTTDISTALALDADATAAMFFPASELSHGTSAYFPRFAEEAHRWNMPVMAEALPYGFEPHPDSHKVEAVSMTCRMAVENGADLVKTFYTGEREGFKKVVQTCFAPVLVLGGPRTQSEEGFFAQIRDAIDAGAVGVVIGRNIWQAPSPRAMTRALVALVHHDASAADAVRILHDAS